MLTRTERDTIVRAIESKSCHLTGDQWEGGHGKKKAGTYP